MPLRDDRRGEALDADDAARIATGSSPEDTESWRERRSSPGSGLPARLPGQLTSGCESEILLLPVTVAGPHRHCTGFRVPHSRRIVTRILPGSLFLGKRVRDQRLQTRALALVRGTRSEERRVGRE